MYVSREDFYHVAVFFFPPSSPTQGKAIGVGIGCILGMFPLLFFKDDDKKKEGQAEAEKESQSPPAPTEGSKNWNLQPPQDRYSLESMRMLN